MREVHLLLILKVFSQCRSDIMRNNFLMTVSGPPGHFMPIDLNTEHLIGYLKQLFSSKGIYGSWDRLGEVSAAIVELQDVKKHFGDMLETSYKNLTKKPADVAVLVWRIADTVGDLKIQKTEIRAMNVTAQRAPDLFAVGWGKIASSTLRTFNKKMRAIIEGNVFDAEIDELAAPAFSFDTDRSTNDD